MSTEMIIAIARDTVVTFLLMSAPMLIAGAVIGILISMVQTVTQLKDQSLTFIPKIVIVLIIGIFSTPFFMQTLISFTNRIFILMEKLGKGY